ncbi:PilZ domain-containing protein [Marinobacter daepoensis]|uniref:PilZ domain-containing protein n=1 Tax=Marinobacter daepoensis TaxID=262077 RepID=A0ABS3BFF2_9GAMM|nr:PilZ domain-containing protein [Marinobacter daepoensis]MBN7768965.1 PilZ domain-containing protein [Marinobacter daepoensis]MBY6077655.1 PilZ domain-containing protein [Marinobacter daepoensis]
MSDDDYEFGAEKVLPSGQELRQEYRLIARARAWILSESPEPGSEMDGDVTEKLECQVRDISARGFSLLCTQALSRESILSAEISLGDAGERFVLTVEVVWCRDAEWGHRVGVRVLESDETDYLEWIEAVAVALTEN